MPPQDIDPTQPEPADVPELVDLDAWVPGEDVDVDDLVAAELIAARASLARIRALVDVEDQTKGDYLAVLDAVKDEVTQ